MRAVHRAPLTALVTLTLAASMICAVVLQVGQQREVGQQHPSTIASPSQDPWVELAQDDASSVPTPPAPSVLPPLPAPPAPPAPPPPPKPKPKPVKAKGAPCWTTADACVKLSTNQAWLIRNGKAVYGPVKITHGRKGWLTPPGTFNVSFKNADHKSSLFDDAPMPNSVFFNGGIAFHEGSLSQLSHGCIHLSSSASERFFDALSVGDVVQVVR